MGNTKLGQRFHVLPQFICFWWIRSVKLKNFGYCVTVGLFHLRGFNRILPYGWLRKSILNHLVHQAVALAPRPQLLYSS